jgi:hypothetical protein
VIAGWMVVADVVIVERSAVSVWYGVEVSEMWNDESRRGRFDILEARPGGEESRKVFENEF